MRRMFAGGISKIPYSSSLVVTINTTIGINSTAAVYTWCTRQRREGRHFSRKNNAVTGV